MARYNILILNGEPVVPHYIIPSLVSVTYGSPELGLTRGETLRVARCGWFAKPTQACPFGSVWVLLEGEARMPLRLRTPTMPTVLVNPIRLSLLTRAGYLVEVVPASDRVAILG